MILKFLYEPLLALFGLFYLPHFFFRMEHAEDKNKMFRERFGRYSGCYRGEKVVWIHAVSVGETLAAQPLLQLFRKSFPDWKVVLSTTTPTGQRIAKKFESENVHAVYFPFDFSRVINRALDTFQPKCIILMETEIWPNLITQSRKRGIPIGIINGRISDRAFKRYRWVKPLVSGLLSQLSFCLVRGQGDQERFLFLGAPYDKTRVTGNMKFDIDGFCDQAKVTALRNAWHFDSSSILIGASTHSSEEEILIRAVQKLRADFPQLKLIIAPRHPERASGIRELSEKSGFKSAFSDSSSETAVDVLIVNQVGQLPYYFRLADVVFMGGSLIPHGGQNPIEAAREKKGILHGPFVSNFKELYQSLDESRGAQLVVDENQLYQQASDLFSDKGKRQEIGERAYRVVDTLKGAAARNLEALTPWFMS